MITKLLVLAAVTLAVAAASLLPQVALACWDGGAGAQQMVTRAPAQDTASKPSILDSDPRLRIKVNITERSVTLADALRILSSMTQVSFIAEGNEVQLRKQSFTFRHTPLKDVLDSLAALYDYEWERRDSGVLVLRVKHRSDRAGQPLIGGEDAVDTKAGALKDQFDNLSPDQQAAMSGVDGVSLSALPPGMQTAARDLLGQEMLYSSQLPLFGARVAFCQNILANLGSATMRLELRGPEQGGGYFITFGMPNMGSIGQRFPMR